MRPANADVVHISAQPRNSKKRLDARYECTRTSRPLLQLSLEPIPRSGNNMDARRFWTIVLSLNFLVVGSCQGGLTTFITGCEPMGIDSTGDITCSGGSG